MTTQRTKAAAIREEGHPMGQPAPCWFHCECGRKVPAFQGQQTCECGLIYSDAGWITRPGPQAPIRR